VTKYTWKEKIFFKKQEKFGLSPKNIVFLFFEIFSIWVQLVLRYLHIFEIITKLQNLGNSSFPVQRKKNWSFIKHLNVFDDTYKLSSALKSESMKMYLVFHFSYSKGIHKTT